MKRERRLERVWKENEEGGIEMESGGRQKEVNSIRNLANLENVLWYK